MMVSPIQITIYEIKRYTLITEMLTFTIDFSFLCKPIWVYATVLTFSFVLTSFGERRSPKIFGEQRFPAFRNHNVHVTFFKI